MYCFSTLAVRWFRPFSADRVLPHTKLHLVPEILISQNPSKVNPSKVKILPKSKSFQSQNPSKVKILPKSKSFQSQNPSRVKILPKSKSFQSQNPSRVKVLPKSKSFVCSPLCSTSLALGISWQDASILLHYSCLDFEVFSLCRLYQLLLQLWMKIIWMKSGFKCSFVWRNSPH